MNNLMVKDLQKNSAKGFSLVEITMSLGIISFAFVSIIALLPMGIAISQKSNKETLATQFLSNFGQSIQDAERDAYNPAHYKALLPFHENLEGNRIEWDILNPSSIQSMIYLTEEGISTNDKKNSAYVVLYQIHPPKGKIKPGIAQLCVAWPASTCEAHWTGDSLSLKKAQGHIETVIYFNSK